MSRSTRIPLDFFRGPDVVMIARNLLGKGLFTRIGGCVTGGMIVETEAYAGARDRASHAFGNRRTARTEVMFSDGGAAYVYLCYGIHCLFNIVTNVQGVPDAILIRAIEPARGIDAMLVRRGKKRLDRTLVSGPGSVCRALNIGLRHSGACVCGPEIWLEQAPDVADADVAAGPRVGVAYAGKDALKPWRFRLRDCPWTSRASGG